MKTMNWEESVETLKKIREDGYRKSHEVIAIWIDCLSHFTHKLGDDAWVIYEQVAIAALDCGRDDIAEVQCIRKLRHRFSSSQRVRRLEGMYYESKRKFEEAREIYDKILKADETDLMTRKRKIAILKAQHQSSEAIKELNKHLLHFQSDYDSWMELCDLYLSEQDYAKAAFCMEELLLSNPHNHLYYQKYAEIKYTQGTADNLHIARSYFAQAIKINPNNMRALYGLYLTTNTLATSTKPKEKKEHTKMLKTMSWASDQIRKKVKSTPLPVNDNLIDATDYLFESLKIA
ncbi:DgyrCDS7244 [Dimorphilus gyrociliatus]|uniref:ER membrane protein complex subunit 2 n=1 Tax=Dimorphilus gyrociliatus TaxID=2664684 RepID=A0A7I8VQG3_9ANNE|nr:DgyrCDS7244 [Dimorphilus gyrociliatus]